MIVERPRSLEEALDALAASGDGAGETRLLAGGTDLMLELQSGRATPERVIDLWPLRELCELRPSADGGLVLGAGVTASTLCEAALVLERADLLARAARDFGAEALRRRATLGGNLGTASPAADLAPALMALGARVRLASARGRRELALEDFLVGYRRTARRRDELVEAVLVPPRAHGERRAFRKVGTRRAQSIAKVVIALAVTFDSGRVTSLRAAAGSVAPRTLPLPALAARLVGERPTPALLREAARAAALADAAPVDDVRSSARYRREVLARVLERELLACCAS